MLVSPPYRGDLPVSIIRTVFASQIHRQIHSTRHHEQTTPDFFEKFAFVKISKRNKSFSFLLF
jgi:hypothetical protein